VPNLWRELVLWSTARTIFSRAGDRVRAYIRQIVTDDDSTTRANLRHSIKAVLNDQFGEGGWTKGEHWPRVDHDDPKSKFVADNGLMPLWVPAVLLYLCDISHRVKVIGSMCYDIKKGKDPRPPPVIAVSDDEDEQEEDGQPKPRRRKKSDPAKEEAMERLVQKRNKNIEQEQHAEV
jgi:hypothetical protein